MIIVILQEDQFHEGKIIYWKVFIANWCNSPIYLGEELLCFKASAKHIQGYTHVGEYIFVYVVKVKK